MDGKIKELTPYLDSKKVEIENQVPVDTYVRMAENHAGSIVGNLLRNSVFHREEGEKILVYSEDPGKEQVFFHNKDLVPGNGVKEKREGTKAATDGNVIIPQKEYGLGIYIVGKIARLYGGELKISEGRGYRDSVVTLPKP